MHKFFFLLQPKFVLCYTICFWEMLTSAPRHFLSTLNSKFLMKSCGLNALKIVIVNFLKK